MPYRSSRQADCGPTTSYVDRECGELNVQENKHLLWAKNIMIRFDSLASFKIMSSPESVNSGLILGFMRSIGTFDRLKEGRFRCMRLGGCYINEEKDLAELTECLGIGQREVFFYRRDGQENVQVPYVASVNDKSSFRLWPCDGYDPSQCVSNHTTSEDVFMCNTCMNTFCPECDSFRTHCCDTFNYFACWNYEDTVQSVTCQGDSCKGKDARGRPVTKIISCIPCMQPTYGPYTDLGGGHRRCNLEKPGWSQTCDVRDKIFCPDCDPGVLTYSYECDAYWLSTCPACMESEQIKLWEIETNKKYKEEHKKLGYTDSD